MKHEKSPRESGKKGIPRLAALLLIPTLAACHSNTPAGSPAASTTAGTAAEAPADPSESDAESSVSSTIESTPESSAASTTEAPPEASTKLPEDFRLSDYITDFDEVELSYCSYISDLSFPQADEASIAKAMEAYKSSELYTEVIDRLKELFYYENGELTCIDDYPEYLPESTDLAYYIDRSAAPEIALKPDVIKSYRAAFDGENKESLILLRTALPMSKQDWSGNTHYHVPIYVNADGEAQILYDACRQDYGEFALVNYSYGAPIHALFGFGHNQSGQRSVLYSFKDGKPKLELSGCPLSVYRGLLLGGYGCECWEPFLFDRENGEFFSVAAVTPSEELAKIICSDKTVLSYVPDAWECYQKDRLQIIGGKYITFNTGIPWVDNTFVYSRSGKCFERIDQSVSVTGIDLPEQITKSYNVNLGS